MQTLPVGRIKNCTSTGGHHNTQRKGQLIKHDGFELAESSLTFALEEASYRCAKAFFNDRVGIGKLPSETLGQLPSNG